MSTSRRHAGGRGGDGCVHGGPAHDTMQTAGGTLDRRAPRIPPSSRNITNTRRNKRKSARGEQSSHPPPTALTPRHTYVAGTRDGNDAHLGGTPMETLGEAGGGGGGGGHGSRHRWYIDGRRNRWGGRLPPAGGGGGEARGGRRTLAGGGHSRYRKRGGSQAGQRGGHGGVRWGERRRPASPALAPWTPPSTRPCRCAPPATADADPARRRYTVRQ